MVIRLGVGGSIFVCFGGGRRWKVRDSGTGGGRPACATPQVFKLVPGRTERVSAWGACPSTSGAPPLYEEERANPLPPYMTTTVESHGARPFHDGGARTRFPSYMTTTVESLKGSKALGPTKWGRIVTGEVNAGDALRPSGRAQKGRVSMREWLPVLSRWTIHRLGREGGTGPDGMRRWRRSLEPRACARAVGMGLDVESSVGSRGLPWVFGSSLR